MKRITKSSTEEQSGSVLVIGMLMLVLLSLLGIAVTTTSTIEVQVAANDRFYKENLYDAEAAALEAAQSLENTDIKNLSPAWLHGIAGIDEANDIFNDAFWNDNNRAAPSANTPVARYSAVFTGFGPGSSLDVSVSRIHMYSVYGRAQRNNGTAVVRVNYRKAF